MTKAVPAKVEEDDKARSLKFDLEERTVHFGEAVIAFAKKVPKTPYKPIRPRWHKRWFQLLRG